MDWQVVERVGFNPPMYRIVWVVEDEGRINEFPFRFFSVEDAKAGIERLKEHGMYNPQHVRACVSRHSPGWLYKVVANEH